MRMAIKKTAAKSKAVKAKTVVKTKAPRRNPDNPNAKFTNKSEVEKTEIKCLISIGLRKSQSMKTIVDDVKSRGFSLGVSTFYQYVREIREEWREAMTENYEAHVAAQYAKLDLMEERLWEMLDKSMKSEKKDTVTTEKGVIVGRKEESKTRNGDVEIMLAIERIWVRRNEILGITSSTINIQNNYQNIENTTNVQNNVELTKVEFQPVSDKFHGNFIIQVAERQKP